MNGCDDSIKHTDECLKTITIFLRMLVTTQANRNVMVVDGMTEPVSYVVKCLNMFRGPGYTFFKRIYAT